MSDTPEPGTKPVPRFDWMTPVRPREFSFSYQGYNGRHEIHCGDGRWRQMNYGGQVLTYTFPHTGFYMAAAWTPSNKEQLALVPVVVRSGLEPDVTISSDEDPDDWNAYTLTFPVDEVHVGVPWRVRVDDGPVQEVNAKSGDTFALTIPDGQHQVHVVDVLARQEATIDVHVTAPYSPDFTLASGESSTDPQGFSTVLTLNAPEAKPLTISWGDGETTKVASPATGQQHRHTYVEGRYWVTAKYDDGTGTPRRQPVFIPWNPAS